MLYPTAGLRRLFPSLTLGHSVFLLSLSLATACSCRDDEPGGDGDGDGDGDVVEQCSNTLEPVTTGACEVRSTGGPAVLIRGDVLGADKVFADGEVLYSGDEIICAGCDCSSGAGYDTATRIECPNASVSPGLINPHDHLTFTEGAPIPTGLTRYDHRHEWRGSLSTPSNPNGTGADSAGMRWGETRMLASGVTSLIGSGRANNLVRNLDQLTATQEGRGFAEAEFETFSLGDSRETFRADCGWDYSFDQLEVGELAAFLPHVAEGIDNYAAEEFRCQSTSFDGGQDFTESNASHIHSIGLSAQDYFNMARDGTRLIWSPRSNIALYGHTAQVTLFERLGGTLALGTDWTYSGSANMLRELACADSLNRDHYDNHFSDRQIWAMATQGAATASGNETMIGTLDAGFVADIAVFGGDADGHFRRIFEADTADVALVIRDGQPLFGEAAVVSALDSSCEAVDACGQSKGICMTREVGTTYAELASSVNGSYPAFFCGVPAGEPTCVPFRMGEFDGSITDADPDGDGLEGAADNCPTVFNPVRPIDSGAQPDADADGVGDPCDDTPLPTDLDGDGVENGSDNCPFDSNSDQADGDSDNKGDICDVCPGTPNPDGVCNVVIDPTAATVVEVQTGVHAIGTVVGLNGLIVTGIYNRGVYAQDPSAASPANSGIHIFTGSAVAGVVVGDEINAVGAVVEFFEETELEDSTVTRVGAGTPITPISLTAAEASDEQYEGVLVSINDAAVSANPHDCTADDDDCTDSDTWEINSLIVLFDRLYEDADWVAQMGQVPVTGVMTFRFMRRRLMPRTGADL